MKIEHQSNTAKYEPQEPRELKIEGPKQRYVLKFDPEKYYPNPEGNLEKLCKEYAEAAGELPKACETAADTYVKIFGAIAKSLPGWASYPDKWTFNPNPEEILTRDEAFAGIYKRKKKRKFI